MKRIILLALVVSASQGSAVGQEPKTPRWEIGPFFTATTFGQAVSAGNFRAGYGGRLTINVHPNIGFEFQMAHFPVEWHGWPNNPALQGSGHVKLTYRAEQHRRVNVFAVIGPGFLRERESYMTGRGEVAYDYESFAIAYGGGIEIVPHGRLTLRCDIADFLARETYFFEPFWSHHFDLKTALMFRF